MSSSHDDVLRASASKASQTRSAMLASGFLSGGLLALATLFAWKGTSGLSAESAATLSGLLFPAGFAIISLLGLDLITGNLALLPYGALYGEVPWHKVGRSFLWVTVGNLVGSLFVGLVFAFTASHGTFHDTDFLIHKTKLICESKTVFYANLGVVGWFTAFLKAVLCNWMVALASVLAVTSKQEVTKIFATWLPIAIFFTLGYEHLVVNFFVIPAGILLGAKPSIVEAIIWNFIPVLLGNAVGAFLLVTIPMRLANGSRSTSP